MAFPTPDNVTDLATWFQYNNQVTNDMFGIIVSMLIFIVFFMVFAKVGGVKSFAISSFITAISVIFLRAMEVVNDFVVIFAIVFAIVGVIGLIFADKD